MGSRSGNKRNPLNVNLYNVYSEKHTIEDKVGDITVIRTYFKQKRKKRRKK